MFSSVEWSLGITSARRVSEPGKIRFFAGSVGRELLAAIVE